jgi:hypothetical protein
MLGPSGLADARKRPRFVVHFAASSIGGDNES